ncbi:hypothetical protein GCM10010357_61060 [Streptomyces luteireticuli]|uniref:Uncharacterized protein n=1 Tax=Streptomyces luteireticuli TaxID=173858 RepID=A0ABP3IXA5_9ACTN
MPAPVTPPLTGSPYTNCVRNKPIPPDHLARYVVPADTRPLVPEFVAEWVRQQEEREEEERREDERRVQRGLAAVAASMGYDYPNPERHDVRRVAVTA